MQLDSNKITVIQSYVVNMRITGLEPARLRHQNLNLARLPIPPYPQSNLYNNRFAGFRQAGSPGIDVFFFL